MLDFCVDQQFLQTHTLTFKLPIDDLKVESLAEDVMLEFDGEFYFIDEITKVRSGLEMYVEIVANALWYRLGERKFVGSFTLDSFTPEQGFNAILESARGEGLDWSLGVNLAEISLYSMEVTDASFLDLLFQWAKICSCEVAFDTKSRQVHFGTQLGGRPGISFRYERNLLSIKRSATPPRVTRLYPYGRLDLDISAQNPSGEVYIEDYSYYTNQGLTLSEAEALYRKDETYRDDSFIDDVSLYDAAVNRLALLAQPTVLYEATVADLSAVTGYDESNFRLGDTVVVDDGPLGIAVETRIVRYVRYPHEPHRNKVELSFLPVTLPDPNVNTGSVSRGYTWELFSTYRPETFHELRSGHTVLHRLPLRAREGAEWLVNLSIQGVGVGTSNVVIQAIDTTTGEDFWPLVTIPVTDGQLIVHDFSIGIKDVVPGLHNLLIRAYSDTPGAGLDIPGQGNSFSVLARATVQETVTYDTSIVFSFVHNTIQSFTVPDDVYVIRVECIGSVAGDQSNQTQGKGTKAIAFFNVTAGDIFDIYVGGFVHSLNTGGWPNGGDALVGSGSSEGSVGGGSSHIIPAGGSLADAWLVAPGGGGGAHRPLASPTPPFGGDSGFYSGQPGGASDPLGTGGQGATQFAGGLGGTYGFSGTDGEFMQGGAGRAAYVLASGGGGGGGGWYGGGGGAGAGGYGSGGGGGSGYLMPAGFDLEIYDAINTTVGSITISWDDPVT